MHEKNYVTTLLHQKITDTDKLSKVKHVRVGAAIYEVVDGEVKEPGEVCEARDGSPSVNAAKRRSRELQGSELGRGSLTVLELPKKVKRKRRARLRKKQRKEVAK